MTHVFEWASYAFDGDLIDLVGFLGEEPFVFLLESSLIDENRGRYSFIGFDPFKVIKGDASNSVNDIRQEWIAYRSDVDLQSYPFFSPFYAGMMGYMSYDFGLKIENMEDRLEKDLDIPAYLFCFYDVVLSLDHYQNKIFISSTGLPEKEYSSRQKRAIRRLEKAKGLVEFFLKQPFPSREVKTTSQGAAVTVESNLSKAEYFQIVQKALAYIRSGDIYQVNLAQRFCLKLEGTPSYKKVMQIYKVLKKLSPSCFGGFFNCGSFMIVSSSPERFLRLRGKTIQARPMKGTRPRGKTRKEDDFYKQELWDSQKDQAELLMITDLERNDIGRVCTYGSVFVKEMRTLEQYETVYQATSTVEGQLATDKDCFDLLQACFPGGSITGCPKIRSMQVINELETCSRLIYTGSLGYVNFAGDMDFNILIRTLLIKNQNIFYHVGGGIVADSEPEAEYQETLVKAKAMESCLRSVYSYETNSL